MSDDLEVGRRIAAARKRAGIDTRKELTDRAGIPRFGKETLGKVERGQRALGPHEAPLLARALGVPVAYFYEEADDATQLDRIEDLLEGTRELLVALAIERGIIERPGAEDARRAVQAFLQRRRAAS